MLIVRRTLVAIIAFMLMGTPASAQTGKVLIDMTIQTQPDVPTGHCIVVDDGHLLVEARLAGEDHWPVRFSLRRAPEAPTSLDLRINTRETSSSMVRVQKGISCYLLSDEPKASAEEQPDQERWRGQPVAVRLIWLPLR